MFVFGKTAAGTVVGAWKDERAGGVALETDIFRKRRKISLSSSSSVSHGWLSSAGAGKYFCCFVSSKGDLKPVTTVCLQG